MTPRSEPTTLFAPLSLALRGLRVAREPGATPQNTINWCLSAGARAVQLDAAMPGLRPRELSGGERRGLAAFVARSGAAVSGVDLFIPPEHFTSAAHVDRAVGALADAIGFASDLGRVVVGTRLPAEAAPDVVKEIEHAAARSGVVVADHVFPPRAMGDGAFLQVGIDAASALLGAQSIEAVILSLARPPAAARLTDVGPTGPVAPGAGRLDVLAFVSALAARRYAGFLVADLSGIADQATAAAKALAATPTAESLGG